MASEKVNVKVDSGLGYIFFMAYIGALVFFIERNIGFWGDVLAFLQAAVWPAYVLYNVMSGLGL